MTLKKGFTIVGKAKTEGVTRPLSKMQRDLAKSQKEVGKLRARFLNTGKASKILEGGLHRVGHRLTDLAVQAPLALVGFGQSMIASTRDAERLAKAVGGSTQEVQALFGASKRLRIDADSTGEAIKTWTENLGELARIGTGPAKDALGSLGLSVRDFEGLGIEDQLKVFADALLEVGDAKKQISIGREVMGSDFDKILPLLDRGAKGLEAFTDAARKSGQVLSDEAIAKTRELDFAVADIEAQFQGAASTVLIELLPVISDMTDGMQGWVAENDEFIRQDIPGIAHAVADAMTVAGKAIVVVAEAINRARRNAEYLGNLAADISDRVSGGAAVGSVKDTDQRGGARFSDGTSHGDALAAQKAREARHKRETEEAVAANDKLFREFGLAEDQFQAKMRKFERDKFENDERRKALGLKGKKAKRGRGARVERERVSTRFGQDPGELRNLAFQERTAERVATRNAADPFSEENLDAQLERHREFETARSEIILSERMRGLDALRASGADPLTLIDAEEQARVTYLEGQISRTDDEIDRMRLREQIEQTHHTATMARLQEETKARNIRAAMIHAHTEQAADALEQIAAASIQATLSGNQSAKEAVHGLAKQKAIEMGIIAASQTVRGVAALAGVVTAPLAAGHFAAAGKAAVAGAAFGALAGGTANYGGGGGGAGGPAYGGASQFGHGTGDARKDRERSGQSAPLSRTDGGHPSASGSIEGQNGPPSASNGNNYTIVVNQSALGFGDKESQVHAVRVAIKDAEQSVGGI